MYNVPVQLPRDTRGLFRDLTGTGNLARKASGTTPGYCTSAGRHDQINISLVNENISLTWRPGNFEQPVYLLEIKYSHLKP